MAAVCRWRDSKTSKSMRRIHEVLFSPLRLSLSGDDGKERGIKSEYSMIQIRDQSDR